MTVCLVTWKFLAISGIRLFVTVQQWARQEILFWTKTGRPVSSSWTSWTLKIGPIFCLETSVRDCQTTLHNVEWTDVIYVKWFCFQVKLREVPCTLGWPYTEGTGLYCDYFIWCVSCTVVVLTCFVMWVCVCGGFVMCGCVCMGFVMCVGVCVCVVMCGCVYLWVL